MEGVHAGRKGKTDIVTKMENRRWVSFDSAKDLGASFRAVCRPSLVRKVIIFALNATLLMKTAEMPSFAEGLPFGRNPRFVAIRSVSPGGLSSAGQAKLGFDLGLAPWRNPAELVPVTDCWLHWREVLPESDKAGIEQTRARLKQAVVSDARLCLAVRSHQYSWAAGVRAGGGRRLPLDLNEVFERARHLAVLYGDLVAAWEFENEPDLGYVADNPETYAAFLKAAWLGMQAGLEENRTLFKDVRLGGTTTSSWRNQLKGAPSVIEPGAHKARPYGKNSGADQAGLVLMAPLALPPGPYFERLLVNDLLSYTDGFNYHYYGYAEDFTDVYAQFYDAVTQSVKCLTGLRPEKALPVFLTEFGYGTLGEEAHMTVEGRVRQWQWYKTVVDQIYTLDIEGAMAFVLPPHWENNLNEFGLAMEAFVGKKQDFSAISAPYRAGGLGFEAGDFGLGQPERWMRGIGASVGDDVASPALAYLADCIRRPSGSSKPWQVSGEPVSPVVIDFVAGEGLRQSKRFNGYFVDRKSVETGQGERATGEATVLIYNFSEAPVTGCLQWPEILSARDEGGADLTLLPGERKEVTVGVRLDAKDFLAQRCRIVFTPKADEGVAPASFETLLYPNPQGMRRIVSRDFRWPEAITDPPSALTPDYIKAGEEPALTERQGRWWTTGGVQVTERDGAWRFEIERLPKEPLHPARVELPLPEGFRFDEGELLFLQYRFQATDIGDRSGGEDKASPSLEIRFRTRNGNLYHCSPWLRASNTWTWTNQPAAGFTMGFYSRAHLPWRFGDNELSSLVLQFSPKTLPATFEVRSAMIGRWVASE